MASVGSSSTSAPSSGFAVIVGNPPFLNQLETSTAQSLRQKALVKCATDGVISKYADLSATFLHAGTKLLATDGCLSFVQPQSLLAANDAKAVRTSILEELSLTHLWISNEHVFDGASVFTCAPTLRATRERIIDVQKSTKGSIEALPSERVDMDELAASETWSHLAADANGIPRIRVHSTMTVADIATATADFRDQFYGLDGFLVESESIPSAKRTPKDFPKILTTGLVDLAESKWGECSTKILKQKWNAPRIDRAAMKERGTLSPWMTERLVPKVIMATQTKVIEVYIDGKGELIPSLPLLTIVPTDVNEIWHLGAAIASPVVTAWAMKNYSGTALSADAIKLSAKQIARAPLPTCREEWDRGAEWFGAAHSSRTSKHRNEQLREYGRHMIAAYEIERGTAEKLYYWWLDRAGLAEDADDDSSRDRYVNHGFGGFLSCFSITRPDGKSVLFTENSDGTWTIVEQ